MPGLFGFKEAEMVIFWVKVTATKPVSFKVQGLRELFKTEAVTE
jgi:hypothetical protein